MKIVKFKHSDYRDMTTTVEHWIESNIFDATDEAGDSKVVEKKDCGSGIIEEI